jgi:hypothetical protein
MCCWCWVLQLATCRAACCGKDTTASCSCHRLWLSVAQPVQQCIGDGPVADALLPVVAVVIPVKWLAKATLSKVLLVSAHMQTAAFP